MKTKSTTIAILAIVLATALGASSGIYIKSLSFTSMALTGFRMCTPFLFFLPGMIQKRLVLAPRETRKKILTGSLLNGVRMFLYVLAYKLTSIANAVVLLYLWPLFALLINSFIKKEKLKLDETGLMAVAFTGVILLNIQKGFSFSPTATAGNLIMILSSILFSLSTIIFKDTLEDHNEGEVVYFQNALGALFFMPFLIIESLNAPPLDIIFGLVYGVSVGIAAWALFYAALKRLPIFQYGILSYSEIFFGVLYALLLFGEKPGGLSMSGIALILTASVLSRLTAKRK